MELTRTKLDIKINDIASTRGLGSTYSELSCEFLGVTPFIVTNILEKASIVSTENFESLLRYLGQLDNNIERHSREQGTGQGIFTVFS